MKDLIKARKTAERIEAQLEVHAHEVAVELRLPVAERDDAVANIALMKMIGMRPHLRRAYRVYEKALTTRDGRFDPKGNHDDRRLDRYFRGVKFRLNQWRNFQNIVESQLLSLGCAIYPEPPEEDVYLERMRTALLISHRALHTLANQNRQSDEAEKSGMFSDIPLPVDEFVEHIHGAYRLCLAQGLERPLRFLDVGCGGGTKVHLASTYFDRAVGLEYDAAYVKAAEAFFEAIEATRCQVIEADGILYENYDDFDVIYFYRPLSDRAKLNQMEDQIVQTCRPGTILIAPYDYFDERAEEIGAAHVAGRIYVKGLSAEEAATLRARSEEIGTDVAPAGHRAEARVGFWGPIIEASLALGWKTPMVQFKVGRR